MGDFLKTTLARVPDGFDLPEPLRLLFAWVDEQGFVVKGHDGDLYGSLSDDGWVGTSIELRGYTAEQTLSYARSWFDESVPDVAARLWPFAQTGGEGSMAALWRDGQGQMRIVHLGSGSGSMMTCVLADDAVGFLRLLAIGYREICWNEEFSAPPEPWDAEHEIVNAPYRDWLHRTFGVTAPATGLEIVPEPAEMGDEDTTDPFCRWVDNKEV